MSITIEEENNDTEYLFRKAIDMWGIPNQILTINEEHRVNYRAM
ncbi:MAG: hypothetical protein ACFFDN_08045 [Candidatus Hodarchaeota archaeon]